MAERATDWPKLGGLGLEVTVVEPRGLLLPGATRTGFVRVIAVIRLLGLATWVFLGNYELLLRTLPGGKVSERTQLEYARRAEWHAITVRLARA